MTARRLPAPTSGDLFPSAERVELVEVIHDQPMTTTRRIAQMFNRPHKNVLRDVKELVERLPEGADRLNFEPITYVDDGGRQQPEYLVTRDGFALLAMSFTGREALRWKLAFIRAFNAMTKALQRQQRALLSAERLRVRAEVARQHSSLNAVLVEVRRAAGKDTEPHHLANEARLIGYAMTGAWAGLDRETLDADQLRLLHQVECRDVILIAQGADLPARKEALRALVLQAHAAAEVEPPPADPSSPARPPLIGGDA